jgi:hypothetical protein
MSSALAFNPSAYALRTDDCFPMNFTQHGQEYRVYWQRPKGDVFAALDGHITATFPTAGNSDLALRSTNLRLILLGVAARDQALPPEAIKLVESKLSHLMPQSNFRWRLLQLFRAVCRMAHAMDADIPEIIADGVRAWGNVMCWSLRPDITGAPDSKLGLVEMLRAECKTLKSGGNPFPKDSQPELFHLIEWAHKLSLWSDEWAQQESRLPNHVKRDRGQLRRDIKNSLIEYRQAVSTLATYFDRNPGLFMATPVTNETAAITANKGKRIHARY